LNHPFDEVIAESSRSCIVLTSAASPSTCVRMSRSCANIVSSSPAIVSANTKQSLRQQGCGSGAHSSAVIKFLSVLTEHTGVSCNQQVEPAKDWRSDCLEKQSLVVIELCGVLGRLHSKQGLTQSNNNARSNDSAKHVIKAAGNKVQRWSKGRGAKENTREENK
jgi:hypothetical protein